MSQGIVARIQAAPWYPQVESIMHNAGVPDYLWESIIASEDSSLNTSIAVPDHYTSTGAFAGYSYGLFQLNQNPSGTDPVYSAKWAAAKLSAALSKLPSNYTPQQALAAAEQAAWPGMANPPDAATRTQNMNSVIQQLGGTNLVPASSALSPTVDSQSQAGGSSSNNPQSLWDWLTQTGPTDAVAGFQSWLKSASQNIAIAVVAFIAFAFGLWLLGSGMVDGVHGGSQAT